MSSLCPRIASGTSKRADGRRRGSTSDLSPARRITLDDTPPPPVPDDSGAPGDAALVELAQDAIIVRDPKDRVVFWNRGAETLYGLSRRVAVGLVSHDLLRSRFPSSRENALSAIKERGDWEGLVHHQTKARGEVAVWSRWTAARGDDGNVVSILQSDREVTWLADVIESAMDGIIAIDDDQRIVLFNESAARIFGMPAREAIGELLDRFIPLHLIDDLVGHSRRRAAAPSDARSSVGHRELIAFRADGSELPIEAIAARAQIAGRNLSTLVVRDVSGRRLLEEQFRQAQKMEAIGRLAGGIAHDFNNLLSAITGYLEFVRPAVTDPGALADLDEVTSAAYRAAQLTRQLLVFSRSEVTRPRIVQPNEVVATIQTLLRRVIGEDVRLETSLDPEVPVVRVDPAQLEQALLNLAINARDAMPNGGTLTIATKLAEAFGPRGERRAVIIEVADTGVGMDESTRSRAFEPFFTTKEGGRGTGLGLPAVNGVVAQAGGSVAIDSAPGEGTRVSITLPVADDSGSDDESAYAWAGIGPRAGRGRVLLVEDEDVVRALARRLLQRDGHTVIEARSGEDALARWAELTSAGDTIDVVVTDVVMPDMGGRELVAQLRALRPRLPVVYMSGYLADAVAGLDLTGPAELLEKPFSAESLSAAVDAVLAHKSDATQA